MPETCNPKDCPVSARVEALKEEFNTYRANSSNTHRQMFERIGALEQNRAAINEKLDSKSWTNSPPPRRTWRENPPNAGRPL